MNIVYRHKKLKERKSSMNIHTYAVVIALSPIVTFIAIILVVLFVENFMRARKKHDKRL